MDMLSLRRLQCLSLLLYFWLSGCLSPSLDTQIAPSIKLVQDNAFGVTLLASSNGSNASHYRWDLGDGYQSEGQRIQHQYRAPGRYAVTLSYTLNGAIENISTDVSIGQSAKSIEIYNDISFIADSDTNDPSQPFAPNNQQPQTISSFSTVSGVVMKAGGCQAGALCTSGDLVDRYHWPWHANQSLRITCSSGDLNLRVVSSNGEESHYPLSPGADLVLSANALPEDMQHFEVALSSGSQKAFYQFHLFESDLTEKHFQPGKLIIKWKNQNAPELVDLSDPRLGTISTHVENAARTLSTHNEVEYVAPNYYRYANSTPSVWQWPLIFLDMQSLWHWSEVKGERPAENSVIAVLDSGVYFEHPNLSGVRWISPRDFVSDPLNSGDGDGWDDDASDPGGPGSLYHGTHVTGLIAAQATESQTFYGASYGAQIMPLRVLGNAGGTSYDLIQALRYAAGLPNDTHTTPTRRADVINLSLGGSDYSPIERITLEEVTQSGVIVVAANGNQGKASANYPARYPSVISVGALDHYGNITHYTNAPASAEYLAPGGSCESSQCTEGIKSTSAIGSHPNQSPYWRFLSGTSMASAYVSAQMAWLKSALPGLDTSLIRQAAKAQHLTYPEGPKIMAPSLAQNYVANNEALQHGVWTTRNSLHLKEGEEARLTLFSTGEPDSHITAFSEKAIVDTEVEGSVLILRAPESFAQTDRVTIQHSSGATTSILVAAPPKRASDPLTHHLYVELGDSGLHSTGLRAALQETHWRAYLPNLETGSWIQVSTDLDFDGVLCEFGEFCAIIEDAHQSQEEHRVSGSVLN